MINKLSLLLLATISIYANMVNDVQRWEADCKLGMSSACSIAATMYINGKWLDTYTGKYVKIKKSKKKRLKIAKKLLKKACSLGDKISCNKLKKIK